MYMQGNIEFLERPGNSTLVKTVELHLKTPNIPEIHSSFTLRGIEC